jgi:hypothetical protein
MVVELASSSAEHVAHLYDRDDLLVQALVDFTNEGLRRGQPVVLLATGDHWNAVEQRLRAQDMQVGRLLQRRDIIVIDAEEALRQIAVGGTFDRERFATLLRSVIDPARGLHRVFGGLVSLLAARGRLDKAIEIETLADELVSQGQATVLCGYHQHHLGTAPRAVDRIAACHRRTVLLAAGA